MRRDRASGAGQNFMPASSMAMALASPGPIQIGRTRVPSFSCRMTTGVLEVRSESEALNFDFNHAAPAERRLQLLSAVFEISRPDPVFSQVNKRTLRPSTVSSAGARPKCPYAAVGLKIGLRRPSASMIARGRKSKTSCSAFGDLLVGHAPVPNVSTWTATGSATPIA